MSTPAPWVLLALAACGPDLARIETEQAALEKEVEVLRSTVATMRTQMQEMGLAPAGPSGAAVASGGGLGDRLPMTVTRDGAPPTLPSPGAPERRDGTDCGYRISVPWLEPLADQTLEESGLGRSSPVVLRHQGKTLTPHANAPAYERKCSFASRHQPKFIFFTPAVQVDAIAGEWTLGLADEVPTLRGVDDRPLYWVYPGTTLVFAFAEGWDPSWGAFGVELDARLIAVGTPEAPAAGARGRVTVTGPGLSQTGEGSLLGFDLTPEAPTGPWTLEISSPADGPYVLLQTLVVGNDALAKVVTAEGEGA